MRLCQGLAIILSGEEGHAMGSKKTAFTIGFVPLAFLIALLSCATDEKPLPISKSLPPSELAYYCDSFDSLREDVWERAGFVFSAAQLGNIKIADMTIENGRLRIDTKTGGFSKGGLVSKFALRGDFDVQVDFQIDFVPGNLDMDQSLGFGAVEKQASGIASRMTSIVLLKKGQDKSGINSGYLEWGKYHSGYWHQINNFTGSVRVVRIGDQLSTFYQKQGQSLWTKMCTLPSTQNDTSIGIALQNFAQERNSITATRSTSAWIDNFTINAAQGIIESEI
jgi:hypothetical protein